MSVKSFNEILKVMPKPEWRPPSTVVAYCDESSHTAHRYFVIGASFFCPTDPKNADQVVQKLERSLEEIKTHHHIKDQLKWEKIPAGGQYREGYKACLTYILKHLKDKKWFFRCMVIDTSKCPLDSKEYMDGNSEEGYFKFYCVFLARGLMKGGANYFYDIRVDTCSGSFEDIPTLEYTVDRKFRRNDKSIDPLKNYIEYCNIQEVEARQHNLLQVADLLIGAVAFAWNRKGDEKSKRRRAKEEMLQFIEGELGIKLSDPTLYGMRRFVIWKFEPSKLREP